MCFPVIQVPRPSRRERGQEELRVPRREQAHSQNKAGRGCTSEPPRVVQGQLKACRRQRAGGLPSPVSCRGHRYRVGGGYWSYKRWSGIPADPGSTYGPRSPLGFFLSTCRSSFPWVPEPVPKPGINVYCPRLAPFLSEACARTASMALRSTQVLGKLLSLCFSHGAFLPPTGRDWHRARVERQ